MKQDELQPFATLDDLQKFWRPLTTQAEQDRATYLLSLASNQLRQIAINNGKNLDDMISSGAVMADSVKLVVMEAVKRAMLTPVDAPPVNSMSQSQTAGPYAESSTYTYTNPSGDLWFKKSELSSIGISGGKQAIGTISPTRRDIYGE